MPSRNNLILIGVLAILILSLLIVFPIERGTLFHTPVRLGLDLQGGTRLVYQADLSSVQPGEENAAMDGAVLAQRTPQASRRRSKSSCP